MIPNLKNYAIVGVVTFFIGCCVTFKVCSWKEKAAEADRLKTTLDQVRTDLVEAGIIGRDEANQAKTLEELLAKTSESKQESDIQREKEYAQKNVYRECVLPSSGVLLINSRVNQGRAPANP